MNCSRLMSFPPLPKITNLETSQNHKLTNVVDASFCQNTCHAVLGAVCKNSTCNWVEGFCGTMVTNDANMAKLLAIKRLCTGSKDVVN